MPERSLLVTGASSPIGDFLLPRLVAAGHGVIALSRRPRPSSAGVGWLVADLEGTGAFVPGRRVDVLFHLAPIWLLPAFLERFDPDSRPARVIAIGSTSRWTKAGSESAAERGLAAGLAAGEAALAEWCARYGSAWTVLRPTLVYGAGRDRNVCTLARWVSKWRFFPFVGSGEGRRQPVHADDLAAACVQVLDCGAACGRAYDLSGGETLAYREMVGRIFDALALRRRFVRIPAAPVYLALRLGARLPMLRGIGPAAVRRMDSDLCFDHGEATRDFGYRPRPFRPTPLELGMAQRERQ